jgi:hypothetical protein
MPMFLLSTRYEVCVASHVSSVCKHLVVSQLLFYGWSDILSIINYKIVCRYVMFVINLYIRSERGHGVDFGL